ncbi:hypothetical protein ABTZ03_33375 [Kitasatospora sp. NPDC096077]|uniref:hypothetical protein n=1 Tax=Kitasatospora sp. NPDC096077 TaxID=3155544 RepID=UPI003328C544
MAMTAAAGLLALTGTVAAAGTAQADDVHSGDGWPRISLGEGGSLYRGQHLDTGYTTLILQTDGNLVVYRTDRNPSEVKFAQGLGCGYRATMQSDGNFVLYGSDNRICWASNTFKSSAFQQATLVVYGRGGMAVSFTGGFESSQTGWNTIQSTDPY